MNLRVVLALWIAVVTARWAAAATTAPSSSSIQTLQRNFVRSVLPDTPEQVRRIESLAHRFARELGPDGSWPAIHYRQSNPDRWAAAAHLERLLLMCKAYRLSRQPGRPDLQLKHSIDLALDNWLKHDYRNPDWRWNQIRVPRLLGESLVLLGPELSPNQTGNGLKILRRCDCEKWTGDDLIRGLANQILRGIVAQSDQTISTAYAHLYQQIHVSDGEGIQADQSFHQHGCQLYSGGYGLDFTNTIGQFAALAWDTLWRIPPDKLDLFTDYVLDGEAWMIWDRTFDYSAVGRRIVREGIAPLSRSWANGPLPPVGAAYSLLNTVALLDRHPLPRPDEWRALEARLRLDPRAPALFGNRHFWRSDYMVHRRPTWFASVKMLSDRTINGELVDGEGRQSQHLSEGATFIYRTGEEYRDIFPVWDWRKIPGTTAEQFELAPDPEQIHVKGETSFVGGVSDGTCGLAFMDFKRRDLAAHKAWFFFDDEIVCLGAGINCSGDNPVVTTVNQCLFHGQVNQGLNPAHRWVHHDGIGYIFPRFPDPADHNPLAPAPRVVVIARPQSGSWSRIGTGPPGWVTRRVFTIGIDHGIHPLDAAYAYIVLPDIAADEAARRSQRLDANILANNPHLQAVYHRGRDILMAAFFEPGTLGNLTVDKPCLLIFREGKLTLSNPLNQPLTVRVTIGAKHRTIKLPTGARAGSSVTIDTRLP